MVQAEDDTELDRIASTEAANPRHSLISSTNSSTPEQALTGKMQRVEMERALASAFQQMDGEDKLLVKLYYFDNLRLREAGAVLGVHEATASRRLTRVHSELRRRVAETLARNHGWSGTEIDSAFAEVALHLDSDLEALLGIPSRPGRELGT
jgi:DNA-directed RNA polymerase specialized sigma subunit